MTLPVPQAGAPQVLSPRERHVLWLAACGLTRVAAGRELHISDQTIKNHWTSIFHKLGAASGPHALALALLAGELDLASPPPLLPAHLEAHRPAGPSDAPCTVCAAPHTPIFRHGRCHPCASYVARRGVERPPHLWGQTRRGPRPERPEGRPTCSG